ncbi:uncharacterized protein PHALS_08615 [Plasmopara halstedii]|uniref:Uncharacterized protein n=1 Tax=Plasmopara halstedii TaxID=4781 RepID=A0A0P1ACC5_PLAHL|nr:uncharacterized protein PHALS_08615 [Plasmopara halstedii]CEG38549.1 hypothetical protein PHALS_08615 [Plasmopara halstedii]|eukprot:XP_024574918.1 hypothetical protein PHALS_08615 [Plasmopara halstedii]
MIRFDNQTVLRVKRCDMRDVRAVVGKMKAEKKKIPFFVLDEMTSNANIDAGGKQMAAFQRNVFRVCGLVVVIMGTDSNITNLFPLYFASYREPYEWMSLVPRFPRYQLMLHNNLERQGWSKAESCKTLLRILVGGLRGISSTKSWNTRFETAPSVSAI